MYVIPNSESQKAVLIVMLTVLSDITQCSIIGSLLFIFTIDTIALTGSLSEVS